MIYNEDCLGNKGLSILEDKSVDMVCCDLPYGQTKNQWDSVLPLDELFKQYKRIIKDNGVIALFGQGMFTKDLMEAGKDIWRYNLIWDKQIPSGHLNARKMPMRVHEDILIFYKKLPVYNPQMTKGNKNHSVGKNNIMKDAVVNNYGDYKHVDNKEELGDMKYPKSIVSFQKLHSSVIVHPTQKPVELCEYLIKTYTNEGDIVVDNCLGSGSTIIACINTNRKYIGWELDEKYYKDAVERVNKVCSSKTGYAAKPSD